MILFFFFTLEEWNIFGANNRKKISVDKRNFRFFFQYLFTHPDKNGCVESIENYGRDDVCQRRIIQICFDRKDLSSKRKKIVATDGTMDKK